MATKDSYECEHLCKWGMYVYNICRTRWTCGTCPAILPETGLCRCKEIDTDEECPYYEPFETS